MSVNFEEVKYIFTGDTSSLSEATAEAIGLLDQYGQEIKKVATGVSKISKASANIKQSAKDVSVLSSTMNKLKNNVATAAMAITIRLKTLQMSFDPLIGKMQAIKDKAAATFPKTSKLLGTLASAFRRSAKEADEDGRATLKLTKLTEALRQAKNGLTKSVSSLSSHFRNLNTRSNDLAGSFKGITLQGSGLKTLFSTLTGYQLGKFFATGVKEALHYTEVLNMFNTVLGESVDAGRDFIRQMEEIYGLDTTNIMSMVSEFYNLATAIDMPTEPAKQLSLGLTKTAADVASLFDVDVDKVAADFASGMQGMTRAVRKYGIDLRMATLEQTALSLGLKIDADTTSEANRQALRYITIMRQARLAAGDFAKTIESPANQLRILKEQFKMLARAIGNFFIPILQKVLPYLNGIVMALRSIIQFLGKVFGLKDITFGGATDAAQGIAGSMSDAGDAIDDSTKKAKKLKKELTASFDELHILREDQSDTSGTSGTSGAGGGGGYGLDPALAEAMSQFDTQLEDVRMKANEIRDTILEFLGFSYDVNGELVFDASQLEENLINKFPSWTKTITAVFENWQGIAEGFKAVWDSLATSLGTLFQGIADGFTTMIGKFKLDKAVSKWIEKLPGNLQRIADWINNNQNIFHSLGKKVSYVTTAFAGWSIINKVITPVVTLIGKVSKFIPIVSTMSNVIMAAIGVLALLVVGFTSAWKNSDTFKSHVLDLKESFKSMCKSLSSAWKAFWEVFGPVIADIMRAIKKLWDDSLSVLLVDVLGMVAEIIDAVASIVTWLLKTFGPLLKSALRNIKDIVRTVITAIVNIIDAIVTTFKGIIKFINNTFKGNWKDALKGLKTAATGPVNAIISLFEALVNSIINAFNGMFSLVIGGLNSLINAVLGGISKIANKIGIDLPSKVDIVPRISNIRLPRLATGGVVTDPTFAQIGEGYYPEAVVPLGNSPQMQELIDRIADAVDDKPGGDDTPIQVTMYLDGEVIYKSNKRVSRKRGVDFKMGAFER